jgi:purine-binding chemotaxis protein CheW
MAGAPQVVALRCSGTTFGIPIDRVREIVMVPAITPVPETGDFIRGIINLRGRILPVLDLGPRLGLAAGPRDGSGRILVVESDPQHLLGLLVDEAAEVLRIPDALLSPPPELANGPLGASVRGVARLEDRLVLMLDLAIVLGSGQENHRNPSAREVTA